MITFCHETRLEDTESLWIRYLSYISNRWGLCYLNKAFYPAMLAQEAFKLDQRYMLFNNGTRGHGWLSSTRSRWIHISCVFPFSNKMGLWNGSIWSHLVLCTSLTDHDIADFLTKFEHSGNWNSNITIYKTTFCTSPFSVFVDDINNVISYAPNLLT